jgi:signal transduction histidine kinase
VNRVLARQLRRLGLSPDELPADPAAWAALLDRVAAYYEDADRGRYVLERSLELSSREMQEVNEHITDLARREVLRTELLSRHNFNELPVAAWLEDFRAAARRLNDLRASGVEDLLEYLDRHPEALQDLIGRVEVVDCNPAVAALVGASREDLLGLVDPSALGPASLGSWGRQFEAIWNGLGRVEVEFTGQKADSDPFSAILHWSVAEIDGVFDFSRVMVVVIDISDRIAAEDRMRQLVMAKDEFLASVSHELRTPLTSVLGYAEVLLDEEIDPAERRGMVETIVDQASDLSELVEDLLAGARADVGQLDINPQEVDLDELIAGSLRSFPDVVRTGESEPMIVIADAGRVRQILRNLLTNAQRYGGPKVAICPVVRSDEVVEVRVCDSGPPVAAGMTGQVFERYFKEEGDGARTGSVGIGLTIARDLARRMGGDLTYRHTGEWSEFVLTLHAVSEQMRAAS